MGRVHLNWLAHSWLLSVVHIFPIKRRSGLWERHSRSLMSACFSHSKTSLDLCSRSLLCWKIPLCPTFNGLAVVVQLLHYSTTLCSIPVPLLAKHLQSMSITLPPPCLTAVSVFLGWKAFTLPNIPLTITAKKLKDFSPEGSDTGVPTVSSSWHTWAWEVPRLFLKY